MGLTRRLVRTSLAASLVLLASAADAQIVNVQPLIAAAAAKKTSVEGLAATIEGSADVRSGNTRLTALNGTAVVQLGVGRSLLFALVRADFAESSGASIVSKDLEHLRYRVTLTGPFEAEAFVQHDRDDFRRLASRALAGAGPRLHVPLFDGFVAAVGAALLIERERLADGPEPDAGSNVVDERLSTYLFLATDVAPRLKLSNTIYVQPRIGELGDVRVLSETSVLATATDHVSVKMSLTSAYDSRPPAGIIPLDSTLKGALQLSF